MTILLAEGLPARRILAQEGVRVADPAAFRGQALRVAVLNLMPTKEITEIQLSRVLAGTGLTVEPVWFHPEAHRGTHTDPGHLERFYRSATTLAEDRWDGLIITGAPVETLPWEAVDYWQELQGLLTWSATAVPASLFICWGAQAALQHFHRIGKQLLPAKHSGIFQHHLHRPASPLTHGHDDEFTVPVSRYTESNPIAVACSSDLRILASSPETGIHLAWDEVRHRTYLFNHPEYDQDTLDREYRRDRAKGLPIAPPKHYYREDYVDDQPGRLPPVTWRAHAQLIYGNWLRHEVARA